MIELVVGVEGRVGLKWRLPRTRSSDLLCEKTQLFPLKNSPTFTISDINTLKDYANSAAFVIIDAEPWGRDDSEPAEIGLSFLMPTHLNLAETMDTMPKTLDEASNLTGLETHWIRTVDRDRRETGCEQQWYGT